jgi:predicted nucleotidyltransferase
MDKRTIVNQIKELVPIFNKCMNLNYLVLFGSYQKDNQHEYSDIDIAIISDNLPKGLVNNDILHAMVKMSKINDMFEPHFFRLEKWNNPSYGSFIGSIKEYGEVIYSNGSK